MKHYLSFGGGVNSTALMLWLLDEGVEFEAIYADHGADWPETREYVRMLQGAGYAVTSLPTRRSVPKDGGHEELALYDYYWHYRIIPTRAFRHCTDHYKSRPLDAYFEVPCVVYIGISAEEAHRTKRFGEREGQQWEYPLIDQNIDRDGCKRIIEEHGLPVPMKSGCFICPFQRPAQWRQLRREHTELFCKAVQLEERATARRAEKGKPPITLFGEGIPLWQVVQEDQTALPLEGYTTPPCNCGL